MTTNERRLAVAGGTGRIGRIAVDEARTRGWTPVVLARSVGVDLATGTGLAAALDNVEAVVDVTNIQSVRRSTTESFFENTSTNLLRAGQQAGVRHHLTLSIVGIDRVGGAYYEAKQRQEEVVANGPLPWTILRATQFYEFTEQMLALMPGPLAVVPRMLSQPIAARDVARHLLDLADGPAAGRAPDIAGPTPHRMAALVRRFVRARRSRRLVLELPVVGGVARAAATGGLLPTTPGPRGTESFEEWLRRTVELPRGATSG